MADSSIIFTRIGVVLLLSGLPSVGREVGGKPVYRPHTDDRRNPTTIPDPGQTVGVGGVVTGFKAFILNKTYCLWFEVWRPVASSHLPGLYSSTTPHLVPPTLSTVTSPYWTLVGKTPKCIRPTVEANHTFNYNLLLGTGSHIRVEKNDVIGFSGEPLSPVPYSVNTESCQPSNISLSLDFLHAERINTHLVYAAVMMNRCRVYSLSALITQRECRTILATNDPKNVTFSSKGVTYDDECWIIESVNKRDDAEIIIKDYTDVECSVGQIDFHKGRSSSSPKIRTKCSHSYDYGYSYDYDYDTGQFVMKGPVYLHFVRKAGMGGLVTVTLEYSAFNESPCEERTLTEIGLPSFFQSPGYPVKYTPNTKVCWRLRMEDKLEDLIRIETVGRADLQNATMCDSWHCSHCKDYIEVRDGNDSTSPLLTKWCNQTGTALLETSSNKVLSVYFVSDGSVEGKGVRLKAYSVHPESVQCTQYIAQYSPSEVQSRNYPYPSPSYSDECWAVRALGDDLRLMVTVQDSRIQDHPACTRSWVEIRDGLGSSSPLLRRWCGNTKPEPMLTSGPSLFIRFVSSYSTYPGFSLTYKQVQSDSCTTLYAYPHIEYLDVESKKNSSRCWVIKAEKGQIRVQWDILKQNSTSFDCTKNYFELYDGMTQNSPVIGKYCEISPIPINGVQSNHGAIYLRLFAETRRFRLAYMSLTSGHCATLFSGTETLHISNTRSSTRDYGRPYYDYYPRGTTGPLLPNRPCSTCYYEPNDQECWTIESDEPDARLLISVLFLELQEHDNRGQCKDSLELYDGPSVTDVLLDTLCGSRLPKNITTTGSTAHIRFQSDATVQRRGFRLEVRSIRNDVCTVLRAKNYKSVLRSKLVEKCWTIRSPSNRRPIRISTARMSLTKYEKMEVYDGASDSARLLRTFVHQTQSGSEVTSSAGNMTLVLHTAKETSKWTEFELQYYWLYKGTCSYISVHNETVYISSNDFGSHDFSNDEYACWVLTAQEPEHRLSISVEVYHLEEELPCSDDYIDIYDGPARSDEKLLLRWCGQRENTDRAESSGRNLHVVFSTAPPTSFPEFKLKVVAIRKPTPSPSTVLAVNKGAAFSQSNIVLIVVVACVLIGVIVVAISWGRRRAFTNRSEGASSPAVFYTSQPHTTDSTAHTLPTDDSLLSNQNQVPMTEGIEPETPTPEMTKDTVKLV